MEIATGNSCLDGTAKSTHFNELAELGESNGLSSLCISDFDSLEIGTHYMKAPVITYKKKFVDCEDIPLAV